jgi:hypothetical protein
LWQQAQRFRSDIERDRPFEGEGRPGYAGEAEMLQSSGGTYWLRDRRSRQLEWARIVAPAAANAALPSVWSVNRLPNLALTHF